MRRAMVAFILAAFTGVAPAARAADSVFDARGFDTKRDYMSPLPFEHIDPMTGNVLLTFTDLVLPGNAGFELRIQRTYNSKIYDTYTNMQGYTLREDSWAGLGWTLHLGRVANATCPAPPSGLGPIIEMPDGSQHPSFVELSGDATKTITKDFWRYDCNLSAPVLKLPNGVVYTFDKVVVLGGTTYRYVTRIEDPFGNRVDVTYMTGAGTPPDGIASITQTLAPGQTRTITFAANATIGSAAANSLATMTYNSNLYRTWTYTQEVSVDGGGYTYLRTAKPPIGPSWTYEYDTTPSSNAKHTLKAVVTPNGGRVDYTYQPQLFYSGSSFIYSPVLQSRRTSGREIAAANWTYAYNSRPYENVTTITTDCGVVLTHTFLGVEPTGGQPVSALGALRRKTVGPSATVVLEQEELSWRDSEPISNVPESLTSPQTHVPLVQQRTVTRSGRSYVTTSFYRQGLGNFNDYGRPERVEEAGELARVTQFSFDYNFPGRYIVDKIASEIATVGTESFTKSFGYDDRGFLESQNLYGITTTFTPYPNGNVQSRTDANGKTTRYTYDWGVLKNQTTPVGFTISRTINADGTVASETRRALTTGYTYDGLFRMTVKTPPLGWNINISYDNTAGTWTQVQRYLSYVTTNLDGFGRPTDTLTTIGGSTLDIRTDLRYDTCGRKDYESYPFIGSLTDATKNIGTSYQYDVLGRVTRRTHPDASFAAYEFPASAQGLQVRITDEESRVTLQTWKAFGYPDDARLSSVQDAASQLTQYTYNALGSLTRVTPSEGSPRIWTYDSRNLLQSETHPENGGVQYTYYPNGTLKTRTDLGFGTTTFSYDPNDRLTRINRPGSLHDVDLTWDQSDNRLLLKTPLTSSSFTYDDANRLDVRTDTLNGQDFKTDYDYDSTDNIVKITYPSGGRVAYTYDRANRVTSATDAGSRTFANTFTYHASGAIASYRAGNALTHTTSFDAQRYWVRSVNAGGALQLTYNTYDKVGNLRQLTDTRLGVQTFLYDPLDRLQTATSTASWGSLGFTYDGLGNREAKTVNGQTTDYVYDIATKLLLSATGTEPGTFAWDANGNLRSDVAGVYSYTPANMMDSAIVGGFTTTYRYDGDNLRKLKLANGVTHYYFHGPGNQLLAEMEQVSTGPVLPVRDYVYAGSRLIASIKPAALAVSRTSLTFTAPAGGAAPPAQTISIAEANGSALAWTAAESLSWLTLTPASGTTPSTLTVSVSPTGLQVGTYVGSFTITAAGAAGSPKTVNVILAVTQGSGLVVAPTSLSFSMVEGGGDPLPASLDVLNSGGSSVAWQVSPSAPWIQPSPSSGTTPGTIGVAVSGAALIAGTYRATVVVTAPGAQNSPRIVPVELVVEAGPAADCSPGFWYCQTFDALQDGDMNGQDGWYEHPQPAQVVPDPRGSGKALFFDPGPVGYANAGVFIADHPIDGLQASVQVMSLNVPYGTPNVAKVEFYTREGTAWGKTTRTFGAIRFGSSMLLQYGPNINRVIVDRMESNRWYDVRVVYKDQRIDAYVDGELKFSTTNPLAPGLPLQGFVTSGWDLPGAGYVDRIEARPLPSGLLVQPASLSFETRAGGSASLRSQGAEVRLAKARTDATTERKDAARRVVEQARFDLPLRFEPAPDSQESTPAFESRGHGYVSRFTPQGVALLVSGPAQAPDVEPTLLTMRLEGARTTSRLEGLDLLSGRAHYYIGSDPSTWRTDVPQYGRLRYREVYPGVDVAFYGKDGRLEYDVVLAPGADPKTVRLAFDGAERLWLDPNGDLVIETKGGPVRQLKPIAYQEQDGERRQVAARYAIEGPREVAFVVGDFDRSRPLVMDPVIAYATLMGNGVPGGIAADEAGYIYISGRTGSWTFPLMAPLQTIKGNEDAFVAKIDPTNSRLVYSTYLGGSHYENDGSPFGTRIAVDTAGNAWVAGATTSSDFPVTTNAFQQTSGGGYDSFFAKFAPDGTLLYSSYLGGSGWDSIPAVATDAGGNVYLAAFTGSANFPVAQAAQPTYAGGWDAYVAKFDGAGQMAYSTFLGGYGEERVGGIAVDAAGNVFVAGRTGSPDFPTTAFAFQRVNAGSYDAFVARYSAAGGLSFSTLLGGSGAEWGYDVAPDLDGNMLVTGSTGSTNFPIQSAYQTTRSAYDDAFITKLSADGRSLVYSTYLGGSGGDIGYAIAVDTSGNAYIAGDTGSTNFPLVNSLQSSLQGSANIFVTRFDPAGAVRYSTYLGTNTTARDVVVDGLGSLFLIGYGYPGFPLLTPIEGVSLASSSLLIAKISDVGANGPPRFQFSTTLQSAVEDAGTAVVVVTRQGDPSKTASVDYVTSDGTATSGTDYTTTSGRLTFGPGETALAFILPILNDSQVEPAESLTITLQNPSTGAELGYPSSTQLTIEDNDGLTRTLLIKDRLLATGPNWQAQEDIPWLTLDAYSGVGPSTVTVTMDPTGLSVGTYNGTIVVTGDTGDSPQFVSVTLKVLVP